ncbi:MAG: tRNA pseudouridine(13) synthase TruD [Promethearchaeota archaeon]
MQKATDEREIERLVGIEIFSTFDIKGLGGIYKHSYKDFIVKEITSKGKILDVQENVPPRPFSSDQKDRYTTFNLVKINTDTFEAIRKIRKALNINLEDISIAGIKDKCSISVQKLSIKGNFVETLQSLKIRDLFFRSITPASKPIPLASNQGNHFIIVIRNIPLKDNLQVLIENYIEKLNKRGFPNYFGLQRFGYFRPNSHIVGKALMQENYEEAYKQYVLTTFPYENKTVQKIRNELALDGDLEKAYNNFPNSLYYEKIMLKHLMGKPNDYKGAFNVIQKGLLSLLVSSFQSYLFNKALTLRAQKGYSLHLPFEGDVISILDDVNGQVTQTIYTYSGKYDTYLDRALKLNRAVIVAPIISFSEELEDFPFMKEFYLEILKEEGVNLSIFNKYYKKNKTRKGTFRPLIIKPDGLKCIALKEDDKFQGANKLRIEFSLKKGTYATMLIREFIK